MTLVSLRPAKTRARPGFVAAPQEGRVRMLRQHRRLAMLGALLGLGVGTIASLPASLVAGAVAGATHDTFLLAEADGTVWHGSALPVLTGGTDSRDASVLPSRLEWTLRPRWNGVALHLAQDCCLPHGVEIGILRRDGAWQVSVDDAAGSAPPQAPPPPPSRGPRDGGLPPPAAVPIGQWPAGWLEGRGFPFNTIHPGGRLILTTRDLAFVYGGGRWTTRGSAQLEVRQASSRLSTLDTLGSYLISLDADPSADPRAGGSDRMRLTLSTLEGALIADGTGQIGLNGSFRFRGEAKAAPGSESALNNLLNLIGRRQGALSLISIG